MSVSQGNPALASEYNTLRGEVNDWFYDPNSSMLFGDGDQTKGYGGAAAAAVSQGQVITAAQMNALVDRINVAHDFNSVLSGTEPQVVAGADILAADYNSIETESDAVMNWRLSWDAAELSLQAGGSSARSTTWSAAITWQYRYLFASFAKARYFFNSGGALNLSGTITGYSTGAGWDGAGFNEIFSTMGTVYMDMSATTQTGSGGSTTGIGYYDLTTSWQSIFSQTGTGAYSDAELEIWAKINTSVGQRIDVWVGLTPGAGRSVDGTTTLTSQIRKLDNQSSGTASLTIDAPTYALTAAL